MAKRQRKAKKKSTPSTTKRRVYRRGQSTTDAQKPTTRSRSREASPTLRVDRRSSDKRLNRFEKFTGDMGLAKLSDTNNLHVFTGEPFAPDALAALPRPRREFTICCEYRLPMPVIVPFACAFAPEPPGEDVFAPRRTLVLQFGRAGKSYAYVRHEGTGHLPGLTVCRAGDATVLYREWLQALARATQSVNSSPMSPEFFGTTPELDYYDDSSLTAIIDALGIANA